MYEELLKKKIIIEFTNFLKKEECNEEITDSYAKFMKEVILGTYGVN